LEHNNLKGAKLGSPSSVVGEWPRIRPCQGAQGRIQSMLRGALARNSLAQPQLRLLNSSPRLQSRVLRSQSGNGIWRGQDSVVSIVASILLPCSFMMNARLFILVSVSGCSSPSTLLLVSITCTSIFSASRPSPLIPVCRDWVSYMSNQIVVQIDQKNRSLNGPQLAIFVSDTILVSVLGCSSPSTLRLISIICISACSVSIHRP
jgi:hypothetical protein